MLNHWFGKLYQMEQSYCAMIRGKKIPDYWVRKTKIVWCIHINRKGTLIYFLKGKIQDGAMWLDYCSYPCAYYSPIPCSVCCIPQGSFRLNPPSFMPLLPPRSIDSSPLVSLTQMLDVQPMLTQPLTASSNSQAVHSSSAIFATTSNHTPLEFGCKSKLSCSAQGQYPS